MKNTTITAETKSAETVSKVVQSHQVQGSQLPKKDDVGDMDVTKIPKYRYFHEVCSGNAFLMFNKAKQGELAMASNFVHCDGRPIDPGAIVECDNCGRLIDTIWTKNILPIV